MQDIKNRVYDALSAAEPYLRKTEKEAKRVSRRAIELYKKREKRVKKKMFLFRLKKALDLLTGLVLLAAACIALFLSLREINDER